MNMTEYAAVIPIVIVTLAGNRGHARRSHFGTRRADAHCRLRAHRPRRRRPGIGLSLGQGCAGFGVIRADNFTLFINLVLCVVGMLTMLLSSGVVERENLRPGSITR